MALITQLMTTAWDMWQHCNDALHNSEANQREILDNDIDHKSNRLTTKVESLFPKQHRLLQWPNPKLLQFPWYYKKQWMATLRAVQTHFKLQQEGLSSREQQPWNTYLSQISTAL